ncbi:MAG TPA: hypothetical protein VFW52_03250 [Candidatus Saccharimonadales bacterium]|nr:hypothetical protein [Candidatus Saccharimonadales bacterium]
MSKAFLLRLILVSYTVLFFVPAFTASVSAFDLFPDSCSGQAQNSPVCQQARQQGTNDPISGPGGIINKAANIIAVITGIAAVIVIIIGGLNFITSSGNAEKTALARRQILGALIAVVIVALAWTLTTFIINLIG